MSALFFATILQILFIPMLRKLNGNLKSGSEWTANRTALAVQNGGAKSGSGSGSGSETALGMGHANANNAMRGMGMLGTLTAFSTVSNSPVTEWLAGGTRRPLDPMARMEKKYQKASWKEWIRHGENWGSTYYDREQLNISGINALRNPDHFAVNNGVIAGHRNMRSVIGVGGVNTRRGAAAVIEGMMEDGNGTVNNALAALRAAGFTDENLMYDAWRARSYVERNTEDEPLFFKPVMAADSALRNFQDNRTEANLAELENSVLRLRRAHPGGVRFTNDRVESLGIDYMANPNKAHYEELRKATENTNGMSTLDFGNGNGPVTLSGRDAQRLTTWIGNEHALNAVNALDTILAMPAGSLDSDLAKKNIAALRDVMSAASSDDIWAVDQNRTPWNPAPPQPTSMP